MELQDGVPAYNVISQQHTDMSSKSASVHLTCVTFSKEQITCHGSLFNRSTDDAASSCEGDLHHHG